MVQDLQAACCCRGIAHRRVLPDTTAEYASSHDSAMRKCVATLLGFVDALQPEDVLRAVEPAVRFG